MDRRPPLSPIIAALALAAIVRAAGGQQRSELGAPTERATTASAKSDSASALKAARRAQANFERLRRRFLPRVMNSPGGRCDETVGRYCYWDDADTSEYVLPEPRPPESPRITEGRASLLRQFDTLAARFPGDDWLAGQRVRYLVEAGATELAESRARECGGSPWWCAALLGFAHHAAWGYASADSAFAVALATMPEAERCAWNDLTDLLADSARQGYERMSCATRDTVNDHIWWLADPLHSRAGNDRRTEHYARLVMDRINRHAASGYGVAWRDDLGELLRRYGWPSHFAQAMPQPGRSELPGTLAYDESPSYHFLADGDPLDSLRAMGAGRWTIRPTQPRERYAPPYATFATSQQLTSVFRRGDSLLVVTGYDTRFDTLMPGGPVTATLTVSASPSAAPARAVRHDAAARGTLTVMAADTPMLASIEIHGGNRIHRARQAVALADSLRQHVRISDIAFFRPDTALPTTMDEFLPLASASSTAERGSKLGLFWELYGSRAGDDSTTIRVQVIREGRGWLRRAGERVGLVGRQGTRGFGWREGDRGAGEIAPRSIVVDLAGLEPGEYRIEVTLAGATPVPVTASRRLRISP